MASFAEEFDAAFLSLDEKVIRDLAAPLPVTVIAEMLGVPPEDRDRLKRWSDDLAAFVGQFDFPPEKLPRLVRSLVELTAYLRGAVKERRRRKLL